MKRNRRGCEIAPSGIYERFLTNLGERSARIPTGERSFKPRTGERARL